ncbi:hypothetical protein ABZ946_06905 [Streptomyces sp. NPDC046324]|uniref:hypothetical protein n=1 Tax=Streptomyces sp. NPDC046324 TaxID=3154915 RepID=UPI0033E87C1E
MARAVMGDRFRAIRTDYTERDNREFTVLTDTRGKEVKLWLDAIPMPSGMVANSVANTTSNQYIVHVSDRLPSEHLTRVLAHEVGELLAVRDRSSQEMSPVRESLLEYGTEIGDELELSSQDHGRIGELNWLGSRVNDVDLSAQQRTAARSELSALLDRCGLRPVAPMAEQEALESESAASRVRLLASKDFLSPGAKRLVDELARPIEQLDPSDASALQASREAALVAQRQVEAFIGRREVTMPMPGYAQNGLPYPRDALKDAAPQWAEYRAQVSDHTVENLQQEGTDNGLPRRQVVIGGGASLAGRNPDALLVDAVGRWHLDPGDGIVQSADQDRDLQQWMGVDPYQAVSKPGERVSIDAVRLWEDQLATQGPVVNGQARLRLGRDGLEAEVQPFDRDGNPSGAALRVACEGIPSVATGLPPEVVPGIVRDRDGEPGVESRSEAVRLIGERLQDLEGQGVAGTAELREWLTDAEKSGKNAAAVRAKLEEEPSLVEALRAGLDGKALGRIEGCFTTLEATEKWESAREAAPGRALMGDEVAENRFNPGDAKHWIVAGSGGTGVANAEIILKNDPNARVTIIGGEPPAALKHQVQFPEMREQFEKSGRLTFVQAGLGAIETFEDENGQASFRVPYTEGDPPQRKVLEGDGYVASLGRTNPLPSAVQTLANEVRAQGGEISGDLLFDKDDQYIGYGLTVRTKGGQEHRVDVDGAASWQLPREVFPPESGVQAELNAMGLRGLPSETGNAAPGFSPIARQSALKARAVAAERAGDENAVQRRADIPERWQRPGPAVETEGPGSGPGPSPSAPVQEQQVDVSRQPVDVPKQQVDVPKQPVDAPGQPTPQQPAPRAPRPAPGRGAPDSHLWQLGVPQSRPARATGPAQPQQPPPDLQRPGPDLGMSD